ncbi:MAG: zinc ribbon domain-containing protein [Thermoleophilaceae bacterium]|nr:zinc ribbon domain-containing protein [Thermoleophilaceae bacterium]
MATTETFPTEQLGGSGEPCAGCGAPLAADQRYCLECGGRRAATRVPYAELLAGRTSDDVLVVPARVDARIPPRRPAAALLAAAGPAGAAVLLGLGILIGVLVADDGDQRPQQIAAPAPQKPPIINVNAGGGGGSESAGEELTGDWPEGKDGFTVQLQALPKDSSDVAAVDKAKSAAQSKGAPGVGALDSDLYGSLDPGEYVVYSGVFTGKAAKKKATAALKKLKKDFSDAKVVEVKSGEDKALEAKGERPEEKAKTVDKQTLKDLESATGAEQQKKSAKLPDTLKLPGKPPPPDQKKAGGGTEEQVIE